MAARDEDGVSLAALLTNGRFARGSQRTVKRSCRAISSAGASCGWCGPRRRGYVDAPNPEFYDLTTDPGEAISLFEVREAEANRVKRTLDAVVRASTPGDVVAPRVRTDPQMTEQLMSLGYIGGSPVSNTSGAALADPKDKLTVYALTMSRRSRLCRSRAA